MKKHVKVLLSASVMAVSALASVNAMAELSMNVGATSNYIWRGVTQTGDEAAVSGGIDYSHESGLYVGAWTSSLGNSGAGAEFDYYVGFGGSYGDFSYDANVTAITYPQMTDWDFTEFGLSGSYSFFTVGVNRTIASDATDVADTSQPFMSGDMYYHITAEVPVADDYTVGLTYGSYKFDDTSDGTDVDIDYTHYQLALTKSAGDFGDITLAYDKNDMDDDPATDYKEDSGRISVSWSKSF